MAGRYLKRKQNIGPEIIYISVKTLNGRLSRVITLDDLMRKKVFTDNKLKALMHFLNNYDVVVVWGKKQLQMITAECLRRNINPAPLHELMHFEMKEFAVEYLGFDGEDIKSLAVYLKVKRFKDDVIVLRLIFNKMLGLVRVVKPELAL